MVTVEGSAGWTHRSAAVRRLTEVMHSWWNSQTNIFNWNWSAFYYPIVCLEKTDDCSRRRCIIPNNLVYICDLTVLQQRANSRLKDPDLFFGSAVSDQSCGTMLPKITWFFNLRENLWKEEVVNATECNTGKQWWPLLATALIPGVNFSFILFIDFSENRYERHLIRTKNKY